MPQTYRSGKGQNTYRVREVSNIGKISFSRIVLVSADDVSSKLLVYPNPVSNQTIQIRMDEPATLEIFNNIGSVVYKNQLPIGLHTITLPALPSGTYRVRTGSKQANLIVQ
ncbi:MAG: T9SS type A sorting domain-containing protein [Bacteroidota bacterium]